MNEDLAPQPPDALTHKSRGSAKTPIRRPTYPAHFGLTIWWCVCSLPPGKRKTTPGPSSGPQRGKWGSRPHDNGLHRADNKLQQRADQAIAVLTQRSGLESQPPVRHRDSVTTQLSGLTHQSLLYEASRKCCCAAARFLCTGRYNPAFPFTSFPHFFAFFLFLLLFFITFFYYFFFYYFFFYYFLFFITFFSFLSFFYFFYPFFLFFSFVWWVGRKEIGCPMVFHGCCRTVTKFGKNCKTYHRSGPELLQAACSRVNKYM